MEPYKSKHVAFKGSRGERVLITISVGGGLSLAGSEVEAIADHLADQAMHAIASATYLGAKLNKIEAR